MARAVALIEGAEGIALDDLAAQVGYAPHHFQRLFRRATGVTPRRLCPRGCAPAAPPRRSPRRKA
ncbi:MAG: helix-turn-helix transcriptional regulator [Sphingomonas sp.]